MKLYVANVGVNTADASTRGLRSPVFDDGTFEFVPIKESKSAVRKALYTYDSIPCYNAPSETISKYVPEKVHEYKAHNDPEFQSFTYGDIDSPRAANLRKIEPTDVLVFLARLWNHDSNRFTSGSDFYFIGYFEIESVHRFGTKDQLAEVLERIKRRLGNNAHFIKFQNGATEPFFVVCGHPKRSKRLKKALRVTPQVAGLLFGGDYVPEKDEFRSRENGRIVRNKTNGRPRLFKNFHSITRSIQPFLDSHVEPDGRCISRLMALL